VRFIDTVGRVDEQDIAQGGHRTAAHVVLGEPQFGHHVVPPDRVRFVLVGHRDDLEGAECRAFQGDAELTCLARDLRLQDPLFPRILSGDTQRFGKLHARGGETLAQRIGHDAIGQRRHSRPDLVPSRIVAAADVEQPASFVLNGTVVPVVVESVRVQTDDLTATGDVPQPPAFDEGRAADTLQRPIVDSPCRQLFARRLPQERTVLFVEAEQAAQVHVGRIPFQVSGTVVGPHVDAPIGDHGVSVRLAADPRDPLDIVGPLSQPLAGPPVELADLPLDRDPFGDRRVIAMRGSAPLRPVSRLDHSQRIACRRGGPRGLGR
jgi:hypothetical protein